MRCSTVPPSDVPLFHHQMFHCSTMRFCTVPPWLLHCFTIRFSTVPPSLFHCSTVRCSIGLALDVLPFHHDVPLFHHQMLYCFTISVPLSTIKCSTVPPWLFHFSLSDVLLFHHQMFHSSSITWFTVPLFLCSAIPLFHSFTMSVQLFHHLFSTVWLRDVALFNHHMFYYSTISVPLFHHDCSTFPPSDVLHFSSNHLYPVLTHCNPL